MSIGKFSVQGSAALKTSSGGGADPLIKLLETPGDLPSLPTILSEIQNIINNPKSSGSDLREVIEQDPSMTAAVLKLINSAYYAIPGGVSNLQRAIAYLGYDAIYQVALTVSVLKSFKVTDFKNFKLGDFWKHSLCVATWAQEIGKALKHSKPSDCFTAGLMHDLGKIFVAKHDPDRLIQVVTKTFAENKTFFEVEMEFLPLHHTEIGFKLASFWRLPRKICFCMKFHHHLDPATRKEAIPEENQMIDIVIYANAQAHLQKIGNSGYVPQSIDVSSVAKRLLLTESQIKKLTEDVNVKMQGASAFLNLLG